jgi:extracellular factor (EF) 3-hydroxypalmitic acid methyl ester biosynthesis protein
MSQNSSSQRVVSSVYGVLEHEGLTGAAGSSVRFRPARLSARDRAARLACRFRHAGTTVGPLQILDLSMTGFLAASSTPLDLDPGTALDGFELLAGGQPIWTGGAAVVRSGEGQFGARFTSGVVDLRCLQLDATLDGRLTGLREQCESLPPEWRSGVADLRQLLEAVRGELDDIERGDGYDPIRPSDDEARLFDRLRSRWGVVYYEAASALHAASKKLDPRQVVLGHRYASSMLMPVLRACPLHRRAYEKPLGYAGDYRMMELCYAQEPGGEGLFGRFLHTIGQHYTLARAVVSREVVARSAIRAAASTDGDSPVRILALAAGAAIEARRFVEETAILQRPVELILLDQDLGAHETAHRHIARALLERHRDSLPVTVHGLHFSVRQLLKPSTAEDRWVVSEMLSDLDLAYSAGLYDYLSDRLAAALTRFLYSRIRPGGRLLLGNLVETPDSTWIMNYVWGWPLVYRDEERMLRLADGLRASGPRVTITRDATEKCLFLDVTKPL